MKNIQAQQHTRTAEKLYSVNYTENNKKNYFKIIL